MFLSTALFGAVTPAALAQANANKPVAKSTSKMTMPAKGKQAASKKTVAEVKYKAHCGMIYSAADAKKYHYICPMDHKPLVKITSAKSSGQTGGKSMKSM